MLCDASEDLVHERRFVRALACFELRVDLHIVDPYLETATLGRYELEGRDVLLELNEDLFRQTDGAGLVVSNGAILDCHSHATLLRLS